MKTPNCFHPCGRIAGPVPTAGLFSRVSVMLALALAGTAHAATNTVTSLADSGIGSLRQVIFDSNANPGGDLIRFASAARDGTITLTSGELAITDALRIDGPGADRLAVNGNDASRVFRIASGAAAGPSSALSVPAWRRNRRREAFSVRMRGFLCVGRSILEGAGRR